MVCVLRGFEELLPEMPNRGLSAVALCRENLMPQTPRVHFFGERGDYAAERRELAVQLLLLLCQSRDSRQYLHFCTSKASKVEHLICGRWFSCLPYTRGAASRTP